MPEVPDFVRLSLVTKRQDIINFAEAMCSDEMELTIVSDFSELKISKSTLLLIDASLFEDFDIRTLEYGEKYSRVSICILPPDIPKQVLTYVEKSFQYNLSFPINTSYFRAFCMHVISLLETTNKDGIPQGIVQQVIPDSFSGYFCGNSNAIRWVRSQIMTASLSDDPVLLLGETGTGKTTAAEVIHSLSDRREKKMISVSLSTIVETLAESSFFGHKKGAFTNADYESNGYFEEADNSTLFLDELGEASLSLQAMLLTVLDTGNFKKIGENKERHTNARMIFATNANLEKMLRNGTFRQELYFRICDHIIRIPPLRAHKEDIKGMVLHYLGKKTTITDEALKTLEEYSWPGNIRELHKCLKRARENCQGGVITSEAIDFGHINFPQ